MIINAFSEYLKKHTKDIINGKSCTKLLIIWIIKILKKEPRNNVEKIIHTEIAYGKNTTKDFILIARSESGRTLLNALYNFSMMFEDEIMRKWLETKKPKDFENK